MSSVVGAETLSDKELIAACRDGGKLVYFQYTISILVMTFRRSSDVYLVRKGESAFGKGLPYTLLTMVLGWWGIPFGPIYSIMCIVKNSAGGTDVTDKLIVRRA